MPMLSYAMIADQSSAGMRVNQRHLCVHPAAANIYTQHIPILTDFCSPSLSSNVYKYKVLTPPL